MNFGDGGGDFPIQGPTPISLLLIHWGYFKWSPENEQYMYVKT